MSANLKAAKGLVDRMGDKLSRMIRRGVVKITSASYFMQVQGFDGERFDDAELWQQFGLASRPPAGGECLVVKVDAEGEQPIVVSTQDRGERPSGLADGDSILYAKKSGADQASVKCTATAEVQLDGLEFGAFGVTPTTRPAVAAVSTSTFVGGDTVAIATLLTNIEDLRDKINEIRTALVSLGWLS